MSQLKSILKSAYKTSLRPYYWFRISWPVWFYVLNREGRKLHQADDTELNEVQAKVSKNLKENGYALTHIDDLFPDHNLLPFLQAEGQKFLDKAQVTQKRKEYFKQLFDLNPVVDLDNPFVKLALDNKILQIINSYFGVYSKFTYFGLDLVEPVGDAKPVSSQTWHRDPEDKRMCTMFLYLCDVDEQTGPLHYVAGSNYGNKYGRIFPQRPPRGYYPPEGAVEKAVNPENIKVLTCKAGSIVFCDTAGLHKGGYAKSKQRLAFSSRYISKAGFMDDRLRYPENFNEKLKSLAPVVQYSLRA